MLKGSSDHSILLQHEFYFCLHFFSLLGDFLTSTHMYAMVGVFATLQRLLKKDPKERIPLHKVSGHPFIVRVLGPPPLPKEHQVDART